MQKGRIYKISVIFCIIVFLIQNIFIDSGAAQNLSAGATPAVTPLSLSSPCLPPMIWGAKINTENALDLEFFVNETKDFTIEKDEEYSRLIRYFLAALTIPDDHQWVNLSPSEKNRIIENDFAQTEMGQDLLAQDFLLKQLTASLINPDHELGEKFWDEVYSKVYEKKIENRKKKIDKSENQQPKNKSSGNDFLTSDINPLASDDLNISSDLLSRIWIVPDSATVYEDTQNGTVWILEAKLRVQLDASRDNVTMQQCNNDEKCIETMSQANAESDVTLSHLKETIVPAIEKEVNTGTHFTQLRQIYHSMILAAWFKKSLSNQLSRAYADRSLTKGIDLADPEFKNGIYEKYLSIFKDGIFEFIREEYDPYTQTIIPRKYFSGGFKGEEISERTRIISANAPENTEHAMLHDQIARVQKMSFDRASLTLTPVDEKQGDTPDPAQTARVREMTLHDLELFVKDKIERLSKTRSAEKQEQKILNRIEFLNDQYRLSIDTSKPKSAVFIYEMAQAITATESVQNHIIDQINDEKFRDYLIKEADQDVSSYWMLSSVMFVLDRIIGGQQNFTINGVRHAAKQLRQDPYLLAAAAAQRAEQLFNRLLQEREKEKDLKKEEEIKEQRARQIQRSKNLRTMASKKQPISQKRTVTPPHRSFSSSLRSTLLMTMIITIGSAMFWFNKENITEWQASWSIQARENVSSWIDQVRSLPEKVEREFFRQEQMGQEQDEQETEQIFDVEIEPETLKHAKESQKPPIDPVLSVTQNYFKEYAYRSQLYLDRPIFKDTAPFTGELLAKIAEETFHKYGIIVPLELALAQAQQEGGLQGLGRSPKTNPMNVFEYDTRTARRFKTVENGLRAYFKLIATEYLRGNRDEDLDRLIQKDQFRRIIQKDRYASHRNYERELKKHIYTIQLVTGGRHSFEKYIIDNGITPKPTPFLVAYSKTTSDHTTTTEKAMLASQNPTQNDQASVARHNDVGWSAGFNVITDEISPTSTNVGGIDMNRDWLNLNVQKQRITNAPDTGSLSHLPALDHLRGFIAQITSITAVENIHSVLSLPPQFVP